MKEFFLNTVIGVIVISVVGSAIWSLLSLIPLNWRWEYHLKDSNAATFPQSQGFKKDPENNNQWYRNGMPWSNTKEVKEEDIPFESGRGYKLFLTKWLKKKVILYRRHGNETVKTYIMYLDADYS
jgi:hypothetical protein